MIQISCNFNNLKEGLKLADNLFNARFPPEEKYYILAFISSKSKKDISDSRKLTVKSNPPQNEIPIYKSEMRLAKLSGCQDPKKGLIINWNQFIIKPNEENGQFPNLKILLHR